MTNGQINEISRSGGDEGYVEQISCTHILVHASLGEELEELELSQRPQTK